MNIEVRALFGFSSCISDQTVALSISSLYLRSQAYLVTCRPASSIGRSGRLSDWDSYNSLQFCCRRPGFLQSQQPVTWCVCSLNQCMALLDRNRSAWSCWETQGYYFYLRSWCYLTSNHYTRCLSRGPSQSYLPILFQVDKLSSSWMLYFSRADNAEGFSQVFPSRWMILFSFWLLMYHFHFCSVQL